MEKSELMDTLESEEDREKKRKLEEMCEGKLTRPSEDALFLRKEIIDALKRSDEKKMESYSRKTNEKIESYLGKTDEKMEKFLQKITDSVGTQLQGMNSTIVKMKEEDDRYKQFNERITNMERKILDMDGKYENRSDDPRGPHGDQNQGKAVITGFLSETSGSEVIQLLKESIKEIGMSIEECED